jgi:hypothetical protein
MPSQRCGARSKRTGHPCQLTAVYRNGRCKFHGGLSTGPRTIEGKARSSMNACSKNEPHEGEKVLARGADASCPAQADKDPKVTTRASGFKQPPAHPTSGLESVLAWIALRPHRAHSAAQIGDGVGMSVWSVRWSLQALSRKGLVAVSSAPEGVRTGQSWRVTRQGREAALQRLIHEREGATSTG